MPLDAYINLAHFSGGRYEGIWPIHDIHSLFLMDVEGERYLMVDADKGFPEDTNIFHLTDAKRLPHSRLHTIVAVEPSGTKSMRAAFSSSVKKADATVLDVPLTSVTVDCFSHPVAIGEELKNTTTTVSLNYHGNHESRLIAEMKSLGKPVVDVETIVGHGYFDNDIFDMVQVDEFFVSGETAYHLRPVARSRPEPVLWSSREGRTLMVGSRDSKPFARDVARYVPQGWLVENGVVPRMIDVPA